MFRVLKYLPLNIKRRLVSVKKSKIRTASNLKTPWIRMEILTLGCLEIRSKKLSHSKQGEA